MHHDFDKKTNKILLLRSLRPAIIIFSLIITSFSIIETQITNGKLIHNDYIAY